MKWCNYYGLIFMAVLMIPNTVYAIKCKNGFDGDYHNKSAEITEQISRYACFILMIFNIPYTWLGFWFSYGLIVYVVVNAVLVSAYCVIWIILWKKSGIVKALLLSILPSLTFIFSAVMIVSIPLFVFAVIFAVTHILISVKNVKSSCKTKIEEKV
ncbi:MAG: hypothetical protein HFE48_04290 [Clostridia bacterium]|nr:hypothetical protein [Clostridia bacterium]